MTPSFTPSSASHAVQRRLVDRRILLRRDVAVAGAVHHAIELQSYAVQPRCGHGVAPAMMPS